MSTLAKSLAAAAGNAGGDKQNVADVFSTYLYKGTGSAQTITNGIDLSTEGGLVWSKSRSSGVGVGDNYHQLYDTERGSDKYIFSNETNAEVTSSLPLTSFNSDGYSIGTANANNQSGQDFASWTFRKAPRFFDVVTYTGNGTAGRTIAHDLGVAPGMIIIKQLNTTRNWEVYHRSLGVETGDYPYILQLNTTSAQIGNQTFFQSGITSTEFKIAHYNAVNESGGSYVAYLFAHDPVGENDDGMIACGSFTTDAAADATVTLGWEPQYVMFKVSTAAASWEIQDSMRGFTAEGVSSQHLQPDTSSAEQTNAGLLIPTADGFETTSGLNSNATYIYMAIRAPMMKEPEAGTEVFGFGGTLVNSSTTLTTSFVTDMFMQNAATSSASTNSRVCTRLIGANKKLLTSSTAIEGADNGDSQFGGGSQFVITGAGGGMVYAFARSKGFFDVVAYTGNSTAGRTVNHSLGVAPEMMWVKQRDTQAAYWITYDKPSTAYKHMMLNYDNSSASSIDHWHNTEPSGSSFTLGDGNYGNGNGRGYIVYLFATLDGVSKVGSYTGNGSSQNIACGFSAGARFVLIKRTDSTGDWYIWDTTRGIITGNDPHLSLNTTTAQVTTDDSIDPQSAGFTVNQVSATNINVTSATYIFLAIA